MQVRNAAAVIELGGAHQPSDRGLTSLGLLMQLAGTIGVALMLAMAALPLTGRTLASFDAPRCVDDAGKTCTCDPAASDQRSADQPRRSRGGSEAPILFLVAIACVARSVFHRAAGISLVHDTDDGPRKHIAMYTLIAAVHTPVMLVFLHTFGAGLITLLTAGAVLLAWPLTLQCVVRSRRFATAANHRSDAGFEGIGVLLTSLGLIAAAMVVLGVSSMMQHTSPAASAPTLGILLVGGLLLTRSALQLLTGMRLRHNASLRGAVGAIRSYRRFSAATMLLIVAAVAAYGLAQWSLATLAVVVVPTAWLLSAWPSTLGRLCEERAFAADMELDEVTTYGGNDDRGLVSLGWLVLAVAVTTLAFSLPSAVLGGGSWWLVGLAAVELWAAIELVTMSERHPQVVMSMGLFGVVVVLFALWPPANAVLELRGPTATAPEVTLMAARHVFACCVHLGVAIAAILFASRVDGSSTLAKVQLKRSR